MKRFLAIILALALCLGLCACGGEETPEETTPTEPTEQKVEDDGVMRILVIGHSLGMDAVYLLPNVAMNEGLADLEIGLLYHSGCSTMMHAEYLAANAKQYAYFEFTSGQDTTWRRADCNGTFSTYTPGTGNDKYIEDGSIAQTMEFALQRRDWDIIVLQCSTSEAPGVVPVTSKHYLDPANIQKIIDYTKEKDIEPASAPKYAWSMVWSLPNDNSLLNEQRRTYLETYFDNEMEMYEHSMATFQEQILPNFTFDYILPMATAMQNAKSSAFTARDLYRDFIHGTDYSRIMAAYVWYCGITGTDIKDCKLDPIPHDNLLDKSYGLLKKPMELTQQQKDILVESVSNAFATPYALTPSQYTK